MIKIIASSFILLLFTCTDTDPNEVVESAPAEEIEQLENKEFKVIDSDEEDFLLFYKKFTETIQTKNLDSISHFIDADFGVYIIESNGAMPSFTKYYSFDKFKSLQGKKFDELKFKLIDLEPVFEDLPKVVCNETKYDKDGCFVEKINPFKDNEIWYYTELNEKEKQAISIIAKSIVYTVVNTSNYTFYFSETNEGLKLSFIDLRVPCEA